MDIINKLFLIVILLNSVNAYSQDYKQYSVSRYKAKIFVVEQQIDSAITIYNQMFSKYEKLLPYDNLEAAKVFASKKDTAMTIRIITDIIKYGCSLDEILEDNINDSLFSFAKKSKSWEKLKFVKSEIDYSTLAKIDRWFAVDQFVRNMNDTSCMYKFMEEVDSMNTNNIMELIKKQGYPGFKTLGMSANDALVLILHSITNRSTEQYWDSYFKPLLFSEAVKGNISFSDYAVIVDRYYNYKHSYQLYGMLHNYVEYNVLIQNIEDVDIRRAELGLPKLSIDAKLKRLKLPNDYKP